MTTLHVPQKQRTPYSITVVRPNMREREREIYIYICVYVYMCIYIYVYIDIDLWELFSASEEGLCYSGQGLTCAHVISSERVLCLVRILFSVNQVENNVLKISTLNQLGSQQDAYCRGINNSVYKFALYSTQTIL